MDIASALWNCRPTLVADFHVAIVAALRNTWSICRARSVTPQEPDLVAGLVLDATPLIGRSMSAALSPYGLSSSMCAVFCHQSPMVTLHGPIAGSCELGDILFAYSHKPLNGPPRRNALLMQAKTTSHQPHVVRSNEAIQLSLYETWPPFFYTRPAALKSQMRKVHPDVAHAGAQYLLIDDRPPEDPDSGLLPGYRSFPAGCCMPASSLHIHNNLASALFDLLIFVLGRPFSAKFSASSGWSQVVWDILQTGLNHRFNRRHSGRSKAPRHAGTPLDDLDGSSYNSGATADVMSLAIEAVGVEAATLLYRRGDSDGPPRDGPSRERDDDGGGVSIVLIETAETEQNLE